MQSVTIPWGKWHEEGSRTLEFPDSWDVHFCTMKHTDALSADEIAAKIDAPMGTPTIDELAAGKKSACIVVDDISRPTPLYDILPIVIEKLRATGMAYEDMTVLIALGGHRPLTRPEMVKKIGEWTLERVQVLNHSPFFADMVTVEEGIEVDRIFMEAELRITIGCLMPHGLAGFSGGAKGVVPGVCSINTLKANHTLTFADKPGAAYKLTTCNPDNPMRQNMEAIVSKVGLHFIINAILNDEMQIADLYCGDMIVAHRAACEAAKVAYHTDLERDADVVLLCAYPKDTEYSQVSAGVSALGQRKTECIKKDGTIVMVSACSEGAGYHALFGPRMALSAPMDSNLPAPGLTEIDTVIFSDGVKEPDIRQYFAARKPPAIYANWSDILVGLEAKYEGQQPKVCVYPMGGIQIGYIDGEIS